MLDAGISLCESHVSLVRNLQRTNLCLELGGGFPRRREPAEKLLHAQFGARLATIIADFGLF